MAKNPELWNQPIHHIDMVIVKFSTPYWIPFRNLSIHTGRTTTKETGPSTFLALVSRLYYEIWQDKMCRISPNYTSVENILGLEDKSYNVWRKESGTGASCYKIFSGFPKRGSPQNGVFVLEFSFFSCGSLQTLTWTWVLFLSDIWITGKGAQGTLKALRRHRDCCFNNSMVYVTLLIWIVRVCTLSYEGSFHNTLLALEKEWCEAGESGWWLRNIDSIVCVSTNSQAYRGHLQPLLFKTTLAGDTHTHTHKSTPTLRLECSLSTQHHTQHNVHIHKPTHTHTYTHSHTGSKRAPIGLWVLSDQHCPPL